MNEYFFYKKQYAIHNQIHDALPELIDYVHNSPNGTRETARERERRVLKVDVRVLQFDVILTICYKLT